MSEVCDGSCRLRRAKMAQPWALWLVGPQESAVCAASSFRHARALAGCITEQEGAVDQTPELVVSEQGS